VTTLHQEFHKIHPLNQGHQEPQWVLGKHSCGPLWKTSSNFSFQNGALWHTLYFLATAGPQNVVEPRVTYSLLSLPPSRWACPQLATHNPHVKVQCLMQHCSCDQKHFNISEVAADWHEIMILQRTMRPSIIRTSQQTSSNHEC